MSEAWMIYGAYGYTGELTVREAVKRGLQPVLAGRDAERVRALAETHGLEHRAFALDRPEEVDEGLNGMKLVLHCAGPFNRTAFPMAEACIRQGAHYLDITGEIEVFEGLAAMDEAARAAGVMLMPGAGFDVAPSDCLALHLKNRMPDASHLTLAFYTSGKPSHGTATTMVENIGLGGAVRREGRIARVPAAYKTRVFDFGGREMTAITIPWGDVSTAYYSTGIPNIEVYMAAPAGLRFMARLSRYIKPLLMSGPVQRFLKSRIPSGGPSDAARERAYCLMWGAVRNPAGKEAVAGLRTPDGYTLTVNASLLMAQKVLGGDAPPGFQTPGKAYGADLILEMPGVTRSDDGVPAG